MLSGKVHLVVSLTHQTRYEVDRAVFSEVQNATISLIGLVCWPVVLE